MKLGKRTRKSSGELLVFLGEGAQVNGVCQFQGVVRIDGRVSGEIRSRDLVIIGETGDIEAEVKVGSLVVMGKIKGNVEAAQRVELQEKSVVVGDIKTPRLTVHEGAAFNGRSVVATEEEKVVSIDREESKRTASTDYRRNPSPGTQQP